MESAVSEVTFRGNCSNKWQPSGGGGSGGGGGGGAVSGGVMNWLYTPHKSYEITTNNSIIASEPWQSVRIFALVTGEL